MIVAAYIVAAILFSVGAYLIVTAWRNHRPSLDLTERLLRIQLTGGAIAAFWRQSRLPQPAPAPMSVPALTLGSVMGSRTCGGRMIRSRCRPSVRRLVEVD
jgi:hypothetical protein